MGRRVSGSLNALVLLTCGWASACGGATSKNEPRDIPPEVTGGASATPAGGASATPAGGASATPAGGASATPAGGACVGLSIGFDPSSREIRETESGVVVEPLQVPAFSDDIELYRGPPNPPPETWDRSDLPAGACVYRLHGLNAACYPHGGTFFVDRCSGPEPRIAPGSFYDAHGCDGPQPGCPSPDATVGAPGYWWYLRPVSTTVADLVVCAPECQGSFTFGEACLVLSAYPPRCL